MRIASALLSVLVAIALDGSAASPQYHLSLIHSDAQSSSYSLDWVTPKASGGAAATAVLRYGTEATALTQEVAAAAVGDVEEAAGSVVTCWSAVLPKLSPGSTIYYAATGNASEPQSFTVPGDKPMTWAVFGDLAAPMQRRAAGISLLALKEAATKGQFQGILNLGDISYELVTKNGQDYMEALAEITATRPMQATIGNHEHEHAMAPEFALQNYQRRFAGLTRGPGAVSGSASSEFYSFDAGLIHFVFLNTEIYGNEAFFAPQADGTWKPDEAARRTAATAQAQWLAFDLSRVARDKTPYVVVCGHRPPFKTPKGLKTKGNKFAEEIVPLLSKYQVDLYFSGHEHTYAVFEASKFGDFDLPPVIISGSAGNNEFIRTKAEMKIEGFTPEKIIIPKYGYGYLTATTEALEWKWGSTATDGTKDPKARSWVLEDELTVKRRTIASPTTKEGKPVKEPVAVDKLATEVANESAGSGGRSSTSSGAGTGNGRVSAAPISGSGAGGGGAGQVAKTTKPPGSGAEVIGVAMMTVLASVVSAVIIIC